MPFQKGNKVNLERIPWNKGRPWSNEIKNKISKSAKKNTSRFWKGKKFSETHCKNISNSKMGKKNANWKGGKYLDDKGYVIIRNYQHPFRQKHNKIFEHRIVMEKHLGRYLRPEEVVHHINSTSDDNRIENLMLFPNEKAHKKFHHKYTSSYKNKGVGD